MSGFKSGFIALIGRPNAGKSTLLNHLLGQKVAIISDKPHTTRNRITGIWTTGTMQAVFLDTPGIHKPQDRLGEYMVSTALSTLQDMDVIVYLADASIPGGAGEEFIARRLRRVSTPVILVLNKMDLLEKQALLPVLDQYRRLHDFAALIPLSARTGENTGVLLAEIETLLPEGPRYYPDDQVTDQPERQIAAELVREQALARTRQEVPHSITVLTDSVEPRPEGTTYVGATIYVERESQKGILVGKKGETIRAIGQDARPEIERLLGTRVYLDLRVKVRDRWRRRDADLRHFGYTKGSR